MLPTIKQIQSAQWTTASPFALSGRMPREACSFKKSGGCQKLNGDRRSAAGEASTSA